MAMTTVIAYDIAEDRRRARVAATLQQWGDRVQRSVFVCTVTPEVLTGMWELIADMIDAEVDSVYVFQQRAACWNNVKVLGQASVEKAPVFWLVL